jgi:two-component system competent response regulator ComA
MDTQKQIFTDREIEVIQLVLEGKSNNQIAMELGVSTRAIEHHLTHIYEKLRVCSRAEAIIKLIHLFKK